MLVEGKKVDLRLYALVTSFGQDAAVTGSNWEFTKSPWEVPWEVHAGTSTNLWRELELGKLWKKFDMKKKIWKKLT